MIRSLSIACTSALITAALLGIAAPAQVIRNHDSRAPVNLNAGNLELQDRIDRVVVSGGVTLTQAGLTIRSSRLTVAYSDTNRIAINRIDALGGVTITKDDLRANSEAAIYDLDSNLITLVGNVQLAQGGNRLNGGRVVIDLDAGRSTISGGTAPPAPDDMAVPGVKNTGGRVTGTFTVAPRKN